MTRSTTRFSFRLLMATTAIALAAGFAQTASAQPHFGAGPGGPGGHGGPGMGMMDMGMHLGGRLLDSVNATDEQRAQIRQIMKTAMDEGRAQREAGRKLHDDMRALFAQPTVDANAVEVLRKQIVAQHDAASKRMTQAMIDVSRVLTPEQRKTLADKMAQRRTLMERHRAERDALDGKPAR